MSLDYKKIYQNSLLDNKEPPKGIFKKDYLLEFLLLYNGEFLHHIQSSKTQLLWIKNDEIYQKIFLFFYQKDFVDFRCFFSRVEQRKNDLTLSVLEDLANKESDNLLDFLKLIIIKKILFKERSQKEYLSQFFLIYYFNFSSSEKDYFLNETLEFLPKNFRENKSVYERLQEDYETLKIDKKYSSFLDLISALVSQNPKQIEITYLNFLLEYQNLSNGLSRSFSMIKKKHNKLLNFVESSFNEGLLRIEWTHLSQAPEKSEVKNLIGFLKNRARQTFLRDFVIAMVLTIILTYYFEPQRMMLWIVVCLLANTLEYYFAHYKLNKIYYYYRLKMPCFSYMSSLHPLLLYLNFEELELKDSYEIQLIEQLKKDSWLYFPARLKKLSNYE
ncbi:MAG: hypothetical protein COB02_02210 [Candidatus Cloacimonadota bacterium]|nr:MAG: hypothetical protein COB02_02210 [Candidatus Cloacimonadota bacterium]